MLYRPLFWTSFWCEDWLQAFAYRGADHVLISSASAKTAFCLAYLLGKRKQEHQFTFRIVGLTSQRNLAFTRGLRLYDDVLGYDSFESSDVLQPSSGKWLYIDVAGNDELNFKLQTHFSTSKFSFTSVQLGLTNLSPSAPSAVSTKFTTNTSPSDPRQTSSRGHMDMEQFFMPEWLAVRKNQLSIAQITSMQAKAWGELMRDGKEWVRLEHVFGGERVVQAYKEVAHKGTDPTTGAIWSLWDRPGSEQKVLPKL